MPSNPKHSRPLITRVKPKIDEQPDVRNLLPGFESYFEVGDDVEQDFFSTPRWATSILLDSVKFTGTIWEPACGDGRMSECINDRYPGQVVSTDLVDRKYGKGGVDFLFTTVRLGDNIVTNPPYSFAMDFVQHALDFHPAVTAFLLRTLFLETGPRYELFKAHPPRKVIVISDRVMFDGGEKPGGCWCLSWFVWEDGYHGTTQLEWGRWKEENTLMKKGVINEQQKN
jgi:hypothetical protein